MGGMGSGKWYRWGAGPVVEDGLTLDLNRLVRQGLVGPQGGGGTLAWSKVRSGEYVASIGYNVVIYEPGGLGLELAYTVERGGSKRAVEQAIRLQATSQHLGGRRDDSGWIYCKISPPVPPATSWRPHARTR